MEQLVDNIIKAAVESYDGSYSLDNPFEGLLSFGELVDRLSIVNFKLFTLRENLFN